MLNVTQERLLVGKLSRTFYINIQRQKWNLDFLTYSNPWSAPKKQLSSAKDSKILTLVYKRLNTDGECAFVVNVLLNCSSVPPYFFRRQDHPLVGKPLSSSWLVCSINTTGLTRVRWKLWRNTWRKKRSTPQRYWRKCGKISSRVCHCPLEWR